MSAASFASFSFIKSLELQADREEEREADGPKDMERERQGELPVSDLTHIQTVPLPVTGSTGVCNKPESEISADLRGLA